jgi:hypothetical protein
MLNVLKLLGLMFCFQAASPPAITPDAAVMKLDEIGIYAVGYVYRGQAERQFPIGWSSFFEERIGVACQPAGEQNGKKAFLLHCPWRGGTGVAFQEFIFRLPLARRVRLCGATAMRADIVDKSDGVTFRVYANGRKLLDVHRTDAQWQPFEFDLTEHAGRTLTVRFETDPGPKDNPSFDFSLWSERELILEGYSPKPVAHPNPPWLPLSAIRSAQKNGVIPPNAFVGSVTMKVENDVAVFRYMGADGTMEYRWQRPQTADDPLFGRLTLRAQMKGDAAVEVPLATSATLQWTQPAQPQGSHWEDTSRGIVLVRPFKVGNETATVRVTGFPVGKSLVLEVGCDQPSITLLNGGSWGPTVRRKQVTVPYYSGDVFYLPVENLFVNAFLDWTFSSASHHEHTRAHYGALTNGTRNKLQERVVFSAAWHLAETLPNIPNLPSPFIKQLGDKIVLDIWGGRFTDIAKHLERFSDYGIRNCVALIHVWQRSGYDNALPMHVPALADLGGDEGMKVLVSTGARLLLYVALHENYVDYYPNYDHFNENDIALDSSGKRVPAWYNPGTKIQSFAVKPNAILPLAQTQSPEIHRRYGTNANYLDVHSAVPPWFHVDFRAGEEGAGTFRRVWDVHRQLWDYERKTHGGPVFGEGNNHWYWSGLLDGVEAQFGVGWGHNQGMTAPLMVDFDLLKIHPLQFNHGMGYYERWWAKAEWGALPPMVVLDQYRMQEVAFGHAGFLGAATWNVLPLAWLEHHLLSPVTARYAAVQPAEIQYEINGQWMDSTAAAKVGSWQRVRVRYDNGLTVIANNAETPLRLGEHLLPRFGWLAQGAGVTAYTALRDSVIVDYAETADSVFANARNAPDWNVAGLRRVRPTVAEFAQTAPRAFRVTYRWLVNDTLPQDYNCFVHFSGKGQDIYDEGIRFQQDHATPTPTSQWKRGVNVSDGPYIITIPDNVPDGDYAWSIGLYSLGGGGRVPLEGVDDGHGRIRLGVLHVRDGGKTITFDLERSSGDERLKWYRLHLNEAGKVIDFGAVRTNGSVLVRREGNEWVLQTLPRDGNFTLELNAKRFGAPPQIRSIGGAAETVKPELRGDWWRLMLNGAGEYRWMAK